MPLVPITWCCDYPFAAQWDAAHEVRGKVLDYIAEASGAATLLDVRRAQDYDAHKHVDAFLNQKHVKVVAWQGHATAAGKVAGLATKVQRVCSSVRM